MAHPPHPHSFARASLVPRLSPNFVAVAAPCLRVLAGVALLQWASQTHVFFGSPVPWTPQPQAVLWLAAVLGAREGLAAVLSWFALAVAGAPVLAGPGLGVLPFVGPTAGYLLSYPLVALWVGTCGRGHTARALAVWLSAAAITLTAGALGLVAWGLSIPQALAAGVWPFVLPDLAKLGCVFAGRALAAAALRRRADGAK